MYWVPPFLVVLLKRLEGCYACESNSDFKEHICVLKQGRVVWHFCEKWVNLLLEVPTQLLLVEPDSKWSETFLPVLGTIRFKSIRGNGFNWWMLATSILRLARNIPLPRNPTISNLSLSDIRHYPLSFVYRYLHGSWELSLSETQPAASSTLSLCEASSSISLSQAR